MNPGDADWWWVYGLDGIIGAVLGGAVTAGAVWLTLRHERTMRREDLASSERERLKEAVLRAEGRLLQLTLRIQHNKGWRDDYYVAWFLELVEVITEVRSRAQVIAPDLARDLEAFQAALISTPRLQVGNAIEYDTVAIQGLVDRMTARLNVWQMNPELYADVIDGKGWPVARTALDSEDSGDSIP